MLCLFLWKDSPMKSVFSVLRVVNKHVSIVEHRYDQTVKNRASYSRLNFIWQGPRETLLNEHFYKDLKWGLRDEEQYDQNNSVILRAFENRITCIPHSSENCRPRIAALPFIWLQIQTAALSVALCFRLTKAFSLLSRKTVWINLDEN